MKLDIEQAHQQDSPVKEDISIIVGCCDNHRESEALASSTEVKVEGKGGYISLAECLSREKALEASCRQGQQERHGGDEVLSEFIAVAQNDTEHMKVPTVVFPNSEIVKKETDFYTDKAVTEVERPKMIICFEKDEYRVVKDICIDKETHSFDKVSLQNDQVEKMNVFMVTRSNGDEKTIQDNEIPDFNIMKSFPLSCESPIDACETVNIQCFPKLSEGNNNYIKTEQNKDVSEGKYRGRNPFAENEFDEYQHTVDLPSEECIDNMQTSVVAGNLQLQSYNNSNNYQPPNQDPPEEIQSTGLSLRSFIAEPEKQVPVDFLSNDNVESGNAMSHSTDASMKAIIMSKETEASTELQQNVGAKNGSMNEETLTDGLASSARSSYPHYGFADLDSNGPHGLSDRITYTGHVPYSGSISLRSESSTTSTRSFAFPILQSEWNSSPVRMAKADRRHYKGHRGWRANLFCCRF